MYDVQKWCYVQIFREKQHTTYHNIHRSHTVYQAHTVTFETVKWRNGMQMDILHVESQSNSAS